MLTFDYLKIYSFDYRASATLSKVADMIGYLARPDLDLPGFLTHSSCP